MQCLVGNKWVGYTLTRDFDSRSSYDRQCALNEAHDQLGICHGVGHNVKVQPLAGSMTPFERACLEEYGDIPRY